MGQSPKLNRVPLTRSCPAPRRNISICTYPIHKKSQTCWTLRNRCVLHPSQLQSNYQGLVNSWPIMHFNQVSVLIDWAVLCRGEKMTFSTETHYVIPKLICPLRACACETHSGSVLSFQLCIGALKAFVCINVVYRAELITVSVQSNKVIRRNWLRHRHDVLRVYGVTSLSKVHQREMRH